MKNIANEIAARLKTLREERGWSLDKTAAETDVSKAMLGQIERAESSPTVATLWKIATGFQVPFSSFLEDTNKARTGKTKRLHRSDAIQFNAIFPFDPKKGFEVYVIELPPGTEHLSAAHEVGAIEHIIVAEGAIELLVNGRWKKLAKGKGMHFDANQAHGYRNTTAEAACFHDIIYYPAHHKRKSHARL